jgi:hypothetical protein
MVPLSASVEDIAFELGARWQEWRGRQRVSVAPLLRFLLLSMYTLAPSNFARTLSSGPCSIAATL